MFAYIHRHTQNINLNFSTQMATADDHTNLQTALLSAEILEDCVSLSILLLDPLCLPDEWLMTRTLL